MALVSLKFNTPRTHFNNLEQHNIEWRFFCFNRQRETSFELCHLLAALSWCYNFYNVNLFDETKCRNKHAWKSYIYSIKWNSECSLALDYVNSIFLNCQLYERTCSSKIMSKMRLKTHRTVWKMKSIPEPPCLRFKQKTQSHGSPGNWWTATCRWHIVGRQAYTTNCLCIKPLAYEKIRKNVNNRVFLYLCPFCSRPLPVNLQEPPFIPSTHGFIFFICTWPNVNIDGTQHWTQIWHTAKNGYIWNWLKFWLRKYNVYKVSVTRVLRVYFLAFKIKRGVDNILRRRKNGSRFVYYRFYPSFSYFRCLLITPLLSV